MKRLVSMVVFLVLAAGCGQQGEPEAVLPEGTIFPHVVSGQLDVSVEEGPVSEDDISEINCGEFTIEGRVYMVMIAGGVVRASGLGRGDLFGGKTYKVTLSGVDPYSESVGTTFYVVSKLEALD